MTMALLGSFGSAATYYVATTGSDSNPGTQAAPFRHVSKGALTATQPGDTVIVMDGTYDNEGVVAPNFVVTLYYSGTSGNPITIKAQNRGKAILDSMNTSTTTTCNGASAYLNLKNASFVVIQGFVIQRGCDSGIQSNDAAHDIVIRWNEVRNIANHTVTDQIGRDGIYINSTEYNFTFDGNSWHDIGRTDGQTLLHFDHGIYAHARNVTIINNLFYNNNRGYHIQLADQASNWLVANNTFAFGTGNGEAGQIMFWGNNSGITLRNNIFYNPNVSALTRYQATITNSPFDHNIIYGVSSIISDSTGLTIGTNQIGANPLFVNASTPPYDFHEQSGGAGIDAGMNLAAVPVDFGGTTRPQGSSMDQGAYEYAVTGITPPPVISGVFVSGSYADSAIVNWSTDQPATSYVQYGLTSYTNTTPTAPTLVTSHSVTLPNLTASTLYHFRVGSTNSSGGTTLSSDSTLTTLASAASSSVSLSAASPSVSVVQGNSTTDGVIATLVTGSAVSVSFAASSLPPGVTASFSASNCTATCSTTMTLSASTAAAAGTYNIGVTGTGSAAAASTAVSLTITSAPVSSSISLSAASPTASVVQGNSTTDGVSATLVTGSAVSVSFSATRLPAGVTASFSSLSCTATCSTTMTLSASTAATPGTYNVSVAGSGTAPTASTTVSLTVIAGSSSGTANITSGLAAQWKLNEGSGNYAYDSSGNVNTATLYNPTWTTSTYGNTVSFGGTTSYGSVAESASLEMTNQLTVSFWVNPSSNANTDPRVISKLYDWDVKLNGSNRYPQLSAGGQYAMLNYSLPVNTWHHVVFTFSTGVVTGYVDGAQVPLAANTFTGTGTLPNNAYGLYLATYDSSLANGYKGYMNDVRLYSRALSATDVAALYSALQPVIKKRR
jgi:hypothetical protein